MKFYDEGSNPAVYIPGVKWGETTSDKLADLYQMILMLTTVGNAANEVVLARMPPRRCWMMKSSRSSLT